MDKRDLKPILKDLSEKQPSYINKMRLLKIEQNHFQELIGVHLKNHQIKLNKEWASFNGEYKNQAEFPKCMPAGDKKVKSTRLREDLQNAIALNQRVKDGKNTKQMKDFLEEEDR